LEEIVTRRSWGIAIVFLLAAFAVTSFSQNATTSLRGIIKDPSGAVVPGAKIFLTSSATALKFAATSGGSGEYQFQQIPPAQYTIVVTATGFGNQTKTAELLVNQPATIDFTVTVQASKEIVNVSAEAQTLNTTDASLGNSMNNSVIQALPSETRNVPDLLSLQPGVLFLPQNGGSNSTMGDSRSGSVNGGRSDQGNITLDGVDDNDQVSGYAFAGVLRETQDSVEEFRVTTSNANADAGRSSGAQVSLVTKSGTNKYHGAAYYYYRPTNTVANNWLNKQTEVQSDEPNSPGKVIRNIFGADVGGPIWKDKLFFFGNFEGLRRAENAEVTQTTPFASYQKGILTYQSNGVNTTLTTAQLQALDNGCKKTGTCPWGPGADPNALAFFQSMPAALGKSEGDGLNTGSYSFSSPNPVRQNTTIGRIDYVPSQKQRIFVRANLQKDSTSGSEQFLGQGPSTILVDNTKGITAGHTWTISPSMVNDLRYGYIRQGYSNRGVGTTDFVDFRFMSTPTAETRTTIASVPVNNIIDNFNWTKGKHNIEVGGNWRLVHQNRSSDVNSFNSGTTNPYWLGGNPPDPTTVGAGPVDDAFANSFQIAYANLIGTVPDVTDTYNYAISSPTSGSLLGDGTFITRHFKANEFEYFLQDAWRPFPNLTLTFGIRHSILQTPWETNGQQVAPTIDTHTWFEQRESAAQQGEIYEPNLSFAPIGPFYNKPGYWAKAKNNVAPRFALAYSPDTKTSIRAGFGMYYDHYGEGLVNAFDQLGSFGVSSSIQNPAGSQGYTTSPRFTSRTTLPFSNGSPDPTTTFPYAPPAGPADGFAITNGIDSKLKTPYSEALDLSVQRELPGGLTLEVAYVGRLGRHLLQQLDLAEPVDFVDSNGGGDYFHAGAQLSRLVDQHGGDPSAQVPEIQYFEDLFPYMKNFDGPGESATQAIYTDEWAPFRANLGATTALSNIDFYCKSGTVTDNDGNPVAYPCPANHQSRFWQNQFSSLYSLSTMGTSYYNAAQVILRHPSSHGLQLDASYTLSKSIDMGSDTERSLVSATTHIFSFIINTWKPGLNRAPSDFDTRHLLTVDWVYQLPVGKGKRYMSGSNTLVNAFLGGWQWSGINRLSSGLPFSFSEPGWSTNWEEESFAVKTGTVKMHPHYDSGGNKQYFADPDAINNGVSTGGPIRLPYPGEAGERNNFRGDGFFGIDSGLSKAWSLAEYGTLKFTWEVYNVTNTPRFDPQFIGSGLTANNIGIADASQMFSQERRMQFSLRYDF
jgi:hypothetical protein